MPRRMMTLRRWRQRLGDAVPLQMAPEILKVRPGLVGEAVKRGDLVVHTFKTARKTYRMVRVEDLKTVSRRRRNPLTMRDTAMALEGWIHGGDLPHRQNQQLEASLNPEVESAALEAQPIGDPQRAA